MGLVNQKSKSYLITLPIRNASPINLTTLHAGILNKPFDVGSSAKELFTVCVCPCLNLSELRKAR
jgi:hypothetical protein